VTTFLLIPLFVPWIVYTLMCGLIEHGVIKVYGNPYFSFKCIPDAEVAEWMEKSEAEEVKVK
jgi:hypothetical protein